MKKAAAVVMTVMLCIGMLSGCGGGGEDKSASKSTGGDAAKDTLNVIVGDDANQFSPYVTNSYSDIMSVYQIYERLVYMKEGEPVPGLAESWDVSDDKKTITFHLREGAKFHNGETCTSEDVIYSFELNSEKAPSNSFKPKIESWTAIDDNTVELKLKYPCESIFSSLSSPGLGIVCKSYVEEKGDDAFIEPVGTGAYKLKEWVKGSKISFEAFEDYNGKKAEIKNLNFNIITDSATALVALENGDNDFMINASAADLPLIEKNEELVLQSAPSHSTASLVLNVRNGVLENEKLRQAIACAIDREAINTSAFEGTGTIATGSYEDFLYYDGKDYTYPFDLDKAKELMKEAGYPDGGVSFTIKTSDTYGDVVPQIIMDNLNQIGIEVKIETLEMGAHSQDWLNGNFEAIYQSGSEITPDLSEGLYNSYYWPDNTWSASSPDSDIYNERLDAIRYEVDSDKKTEETCSLLKDIMASANEIPLVTLTSNIVYRQGLQDTYIDPNGMFYCFKDFSWGE